MWMSAPVRTRGMGSLALNRPRADARESESAIEIRPCRPDRTGSSSASPPAPAAVTSARRPKRAAAERPSGSGPGIDSSLVADPGKRAIPASRPGPRVRTPTCLRLDDDPVVHEGMDDAHEVQGPAGLRRDLLLERRQVLAHEERVAAAIEIAFAVP